jgi:hypothetical protein
MSQPDHPSCKAGNYSQRQNNPMPASLDLTSPTVLLYGGLTAMVAVVAILWKLVMARSAKCEADNVVMAANNLKLTEEVGEIRGQLMALCAMIRGCNVQGCVLAKSKLPEFNHND